MDDDPNELFKVYQFFPNETYEEVIRDVNAETAVKKARDLAGSVGAKIGTTTRIIITDSGDRTVFEWQHGQGVTFPKIKDRSQG